MVKRCSLIAVCAALLFFQGCRKGGEQQLKNGFDLLTQGKPAEAAIILKEAETLLREKGSGDALLECLLLAEQSRLDRGDYTIALGNLEGLYQQAKSAHPYFDLLCCSSIARAAMYTGDLDRASVFLEECGALELKPESLGKIDRKRYAVAVVRYFEAACLLSLLKADPIDGDSFAEMRALLPEKQQDAGDILSALFFDGYGGSLTEWLRSVKRKQAGRADLFWMAELLNLRDSSLSADDKLKNIEALSAAMGKSPSFCIPAFFDYHYAMFLAGFTEQERIDKAVALLQDRLPVLETIGRDDLRVNSYTTLGRIYYEKGKYLWSRDFFEKALPLFSKFDMKENSAQALDYLGSIARFFGNMTLAENRYREAETLYDELGLLDKISDVWNNLGLVYLEQRDFPRAEEAFRSSLSSLDEWREAASPDTKVYLEKSATRRIHMASLSVAKKRDGEALSRYLDPLIRELEKEGAADSLPFAQSLFLRATIAYRSLLSKEENDYDAFIPVLADLKKADAVFAAAGKTKEMGEVRYFTGLVFANIGEFKSALDYYKPLIDQYRESRSTLYLANLCRSAAIAAKALGDGTAYVDFLSEAVGAYDSYVRLLPSSSSQSARFSEYRPLFDDLIWALIDAGRLDEAWKAAESLRGRVTLQKLRERDRDILGELLPAQKKKLDALQAQEALFVLEAQGQYYSGVARTRDEYTKLLESIRAQREDVYREIRVANPQIADLNSGASISAADFIGKIPADTLVLSYYLGSKRLYAFLLDKEGISGVETGGPGFTRASLAAQVDEYQKKLVDSKDLSRKDYVAPCKALYARLLSPMRERLLKYRHVVFIPMDGLFYIPVQTLINPTSGRFFLDEFEGGVSQAASATILAELLDRPARDYAKLYYGFGDAENAKAVKLEYTRQELNEVFALMGGNGELRLGKEASETRIKAADLTEFKYIHLSCHGLNYGYGEKHYFRVPALLFAQEPGEDSHWTDLEISSKNIRSDCVILSACKTALGKDTEGEGLVGLNQAFLLSGANAVVASLWSVADITTYDLIVNFFKRVRAGASLDESLWTAMKQTRGKLINKDLECRFPDHPKLWGAFVLTGKF